MTRDINLPGVVDVYDLETDQNRWVMVLEDFGGDSLTRLELPGQLTVTHFLNLAIEIANILSQIHQQNIMHKDINPANIVLNPTTGQVKIIDFGISTILSRESPTFRNPNRLEGTLAYISPEQTGRMNRAVDYRTDFYSLGVTLYELLTGQLPFAGDDALELVHSHIAKQPAPPRELVGVGFVPAQRDDYKSTSLQIISDIIMKLIAKNAEDRYQSAYALTADLEYCLANLTDPSTSSGQTPLDFELAQYDVSERFQIPQKLYGREREIEVRDITNNVVELMVTKLQKLPLPTQTELQFAACIGNRFDLKILAVIGEKSEAVVLSNLEPALQEGLLLPLDDNYKLFNALENPVPVRFKFLHDRVQQAAYSLIPVDNKKHLHLKVGRLLLEIGDLETMIFDVVDHLNQGRTLITNEQERLHLAELNLKAGQKAKKSAAYQPASTYLTIGMDTLPPHSWKVAYPLAFNLHKELAEAAYLNGNFEQSEALLYLALEQTRTTLEQATLYELLVVQYTLAAKYEMALQVGKKALHLLGVDYPETDLQTAFERELAEVQGFLEGIELNSLLDKPEGMPPEKKMAVDLLFKVKSTTFYIRPELNPLLDVKSVSLALKYGFGPESLLGLPGYSVVLSQTLGDYQAGYEFGLLAIKLSEKFNDLRAMCLSKYVVGTFVYPWVKHIKAVQPLYDEAHQAGLASGELQFAGYALRHKLMLRFYQGDNLTSLLEEAGKFLRFAQKTNNRVATDAIMACQLILWNLNDQTIDKLAFHTDAITEAQFLEGCQIHRSFGAFCRYHILKAQVLYLYGQPAEALEYIETAKEYLTFIPGVYQMAEHNFYHSLILAALYPIASKGAQESYWGQLEINQTQIKIWSDNLVEELKQ